MLHEFREHLKSQNKSQDIIDSYIQSVQDYITWLSSNGIALIKIQEQNIDESVSYTIFDGTHDIIL
jgi:site-specific recombinase XerD